LSSIMSGEIVNESFNVKTTTTIITKKKCYINSPGPKGQTKLGYPNDDYGHGGHLAVVAIP
ncbi:Hypothetical predicted protein, partial [Mytilus galloprovincialis]